MSYLIFRSLFKKQEIINNARKLSAKTGQSLENVSTELRNRVTVVENIEQCKDITDHLIKLGHPIGVDAEATQKAPGLIQVSSYENDIYLFRTGIRPKLYDRGGVTKLLEHPKILKIMNDATMDCISFNKAGIKMRSLYDVTLAHKVIEYQKHGISLQKK